MGEGVACVRGEVGTRRSTQNTPEWLHVTCYISPEAKLACLAYCLRLKVLPLNSNQPLPSTGSGINRLLTVNQFSDYQVA